jgi:hypothetical protein
VALVNTTITRKRADELLRFLPLFETAGRSFVKGWSAGDKTAGGAMTIPYPEYEEDVLQFFRLAGQPWWSDHDYDPHRARAMLEDHAFLQGCALDNIRTMLTFCVRGERFSDGFWASILRSGQLTALLRRLAILAENLQD